MLASNPILSTDPSVLSSLGPLLSQSLDPPFAPAHILAFFLLVRPFDSPPICCPSPSSVFAYVCPRIGLSVPKFSYSSARSVGPLHLWVRCPPIHSGYRLRLAVRPCLRLSPHPLILSSMYLRISPSIKWSTLTNVCLLNSSASFPSFHSGLPLFRIS